MEWTRDLRLALRLIAKNPGATALSVLSIALGIGLTTGLFAVGDAALLRPLPVDRPQDLWSVSSRGDDGREMQYGWPDYVDMAKALESRAQVVATQRRGILIGQDEDSQMALIQPASPNFFRVAGVKAAMGRASVGESGGQPETVLGYHLWQTLFASDPHIVGKTVALNNKPFLVAGVMPETFTGFERGIAVGVWVGADAWFSTLGNRGDEQSRDGQFDVVARFQAPLTATRAAAELDAAIRGPQKHKPALASVSGTWLMGFVRPWKDNIILGGGLALVLGLVLFVACANVAQLRLAQAEARRKELGVRVALGGGRWRVARQLLVETSVLAIAGAGLGLLLAQVIVDKVTQFGRAVDASFDFGIRLDYRVLGYSAGALLLAIVVAGVGPALRVARLNISDVLKQTQGATVRRRNWQQQALVISQVAVSVTLLGLSALFLTSLYHASQVRPGLDPHKNILALSVALPLHIPASDWSGQVSERLAALPGVRSATYARRLPVSGSGGGLTARVEIPGLAPMGVPLNNVGGNYFAAMGTRVLAGRGIDERDQKGAPLAVVVSQAFARTAFPGRDPIGQWISINGKQRQVVGIAEDGPSNHIHDLPEPFLYLPYAQAPSGDLTLMVETSGDPMALDHAARAGIRAFDPGSHVYLSTTLRKTLDDDLAEDRLIATTSSALGFSVVLMTAAGLFGVLLYAVNGRTRELGLRVALGASPKQINRLVISESLRLAAVGVPIGLVGLAAAAQGARSMLLGVTPLNPVSYVFSAVAAVALAFAAAWIPARRATRVDPLEALRAE